MSLHHPQLSRRDYRPLGDVKEEDKRPEIPEGMTLNPKTKTVKYGK